MNGSKPVMRLKVVRRATVSTQRDAARLHAAVPTVVLHLAAAGVSSAAAMGMGAPPTPLFTGGVAVCAMGAPVTGLLLSLAGWTRCGAALLIFTYVGSAALGIYNFLGLGALTAMLSTPASPWKIVFLVTAVVLPVLQIKGILESVRAIAEAP